MKIITVVGARPQFIKAAPVSRAIERHNGHGGELRISEILVHTGQHYDYNMSQVFFDQLKIPKPHYHLGVGSGKHGEMTGAMLSAIEEILINEKPDWVMVYGDTNSTLAGALAASKLFIPIIHIEAGLRSFNRRMPEEINRLLTDHLASLLFCPTDTAVTNLRQEGITKNVVKVGDVMYDAFLFNKEILEKESTILPDLKLTPNSYCLCTVHRQENTDDHQKLKNIFKAFQALAREECPFIVPLHPRTRKSFLSGEDGQIFSPHVKIISPVSYLEMVSLELHARVILTDSGGIQKEAYFAGVPCVTLREETEWVETVVGGWNYLAGADTKSIMKAFDKAISFRSGTKPELYGNGNASQLILDKLSDGIKI
jgi:UDP-GlcNAc3NAcA epimerase